MANNVFTPRSRSSFIRWWWSLDRVSLITIIGLVLFGIVMVATASPSVAQRIDLPEYHFLKRHALFLAPTMAAIFLIPITPLQHVWKISLTLLIGAITGILITLIHGEEIKGATRWFRLFGFSIQPSEFLKPAFIVFCAWLLAKQRREDTFPGFISAFTLYGICAILLLMQPDFGMFFLITCVFGMQIFLIGCPLRYVTILLALGLIAVTSLYFTFDHVHDRINTFLFPETQDTYQIDRSKEAFINGGLIGTGLGQGDIKNRVPDIHADFIFTAIGEEMGFLFTAIFVVILALLFHRLLVRFTRSESLFIMISGSSLVFMLILQSFIHIGSTLMLIPSKGMTLPLISYGGSSLVAIGITFGLILALSKDLNDDRKKRQTWRHLTRKKDI